MSLRYVFELVSVEAFINELHANSFRNPFLQLRISIDCDNTSNTYSRYESSRNLTCLIQVNINAITSY